MFPTLRMAAMAASLVCSSYAGASTLTIESWRADDKSLWDTVLLPAFHKAHPGITVRFAPTWTTEYDATVQSRLAAGTAGDLVTCRPFDISLNLYSKGFLENLSGNPALKSFPESALVAWQTDNGKETFCLPIASVIHGFFYNKKIFADLRLTPPKTEAEFFSVLGKIKASGKATPLALGTADQWETHQIVYTSIGPNYWKGEEGRKGLIAGTKKFTDPEFVNTWSTMAKWTPFMRKEHKSQTYGDSQLQFSNGRAAIYPAGSWDIGHFEQNSQVEFGAFRPPVPKAGDTCYISDHTDIGMGINSKSKNKADAQVFLNWLASKEFADLYTNKLSGFFSLSKHTIDVKNPVAKEMLSWRNQCKSTIRLNSQILNRGIPSMENEFWKINSMVMNQDITPKQAAAEIQAGLARWYKPPK